MEAHACFVHLNGETFGPLAADVVTLMLKQNRIQFVDYLWREGLTKWVRILEIDEFAALLPQYPKGAIPSRADYPALELPKGERELLAQTGGGGMSADRVRAPRRARVRRFPRASIDARFVTGEYGSFEVVNISEGGLYVKSSTILLPIGTNLIFTLESPVFAAPFDMSAVVVRFGSANDPPGFGVEFTKMSMEQKRVISEYIQSKE